MSFFKAILLLSFLELSCCLVFNSTVSKDGTGNFARVSDAIAAAPNLSSSRFYIHVKAGTYNEHVEIPEDKTFISLIGDGASNTVIVDGRNNHDGSSTTDSATFTVKGEHFIAQFITFENSAGPKKGQAVAFLDEANHTAYYNCVFKGYQDTLFVRGRFQFYKNCSVYGSVDFIFGEGLVVFQDCTIYARLWGSTMTAQSKSQVQDLSGFTFQNCNITTSSEMGSDKVTLSLGRPWRSYSTVIVMQSFLDAVVEPQGWSKWSGIPINLLFYAEYNNYGPGANTSKRVNWPGYHILYTDEEASRFTVENFINGLQWLPETQIPFRGGLHG